MSRAFPLAATAVAASVIVAIVLSTTGAPATENASSDVDRLMQCGPGDTAPTVVLLHGAWADSCHLPYALPVRRQRTDRAAMTRGAVDRTLSRRCFEVFHLSQLLVDHAVHSCHLAGGAFLPLVVAREVVLDVAMRAAHT